MFKIETLLASSLIFLASCGGNMATDKDTNTDTGDSNTEKVAENCTYSFNKDSTTVAWTAFKTTEKIGVDGKFDTVNISGTKEADNIAGVFSEASFSIPVSSINTNNPDRDMKIQKFFFGKLVGAETLSGKLKSLGNDGKGVVTVSMNGVEKDVEMDFTQNGDEVTLAAIIDVGEWNAQAGVKALNDECYELHMAGDGVSKLWPDVKISITSLLNKSCE